MVVIASTPNPTAMPVTAASDVVAPALVVVHIISLLAFLLEKILWLVC